MTTQQTLSLGQIARLCHVKRAVATMWLKRPVAGAPFPSPSPTGRYAADEVLDWLERTGATIPSPDSTSPSKPPSTRAVARRKCKP